MATSKEYVADQSGLEEIPEAVFENRGLEALVVSNNRITYIPERILGLTRLDVACNPLGAFPEQILCMKNLRELAEDELRYYWKTAGFILRFVLSGDQKNYADVLGKTFEGLEDVKKIESENTYINQIARGKKIPFPDGLGMDAQLAMHLCNVGDFKNPPRLLSRQLEACKAASEGDGQQEGLDIDVCKHPRGPGVRAVEEEVRHDSHKQLNRCEQLFILISALC